MFSIASISVTTTLGVFLLGFSYENRTPQLLIALHDLVLCFIVYGDTGSKLYNDYRDVVSDILSIRSAVWAAFQSTSEASHSIFIIKIS